MSNPVTVKVSARTQYIINIVAAATNETSQTVYERLAMDELKRVTASDLPSAQYLHLTPEAIEAGFYDDVIYSKGTN